jgi:hypothetical protein
MPRRKRVELPDIWFKFDRQKETITLPDGSTLDIGEIFRVNGEHGLRFKFAGLTTNVETGASWVECFEVHKSRVGVQRSFRVDRVKKIPIRRKRRVKRTGSN